MCWMWLLIIYYRLLTHSTVILLVTDHVRSQPHKNCLINQNVIHHHHNTSHVRMRRRKLKWYTTKVHFISIPVKVIKAICVVAGEVTQLGKEKETVFRIDNESMYKNENFRNSLHIFYLAIIKLNRTNFLSIGRHVSDARKKWLFKYRFFLDSHLDSNQK